MKFPDPRAAGRHIHICDFCGQSSLGVESLVLANNGQSCICEVCAANVVELVAQTRANRTADAAPAQEPGHA